MSKWPVKAEARCRSTGQFCEVDCMKCETNLKFTYFNWAISVIFGVAIAIMGLVINQQTTFHRQELKLEQARSQHVYELIIRRQSTLGWPAVQVDKTGMIVWLSLSARQLLEVTLGDPLIAIMVDPADAQTHQVGFQAAMRRMEQHQGQQTFMKKLCRLKTKQGLQFAEVTAWTVPSGGMGFIELLSEEEYQQRLEKQEVSGPLPVFEEHTAEPNGYDKGQ